MKNIFYETKEDLAMTNEIHTNVSNAVQQDTTLQFLKGEIQGQKLSLSFFRFAEFTSPRNDYYL